MSIRGSSWLDRVLDCYFARRPVDATFIGVHEHDHRLPDLSENGRGDALAALRSLAAGAPAMAGTARVDALDHRLALGSLRIEIAELEGGHVTVRNPSFYTGEAIFGVMSLFLRRHARNSERFESATARLAAIPTLLRQATNNVQSAPPEWTARALDECTGGLAFLTHGLELLTMEASAQPDRPTDASLASFRSAGTTAAAAITEFGAYLESSLRHRPAPTASAGRDMLSLYMSEGHFITETPEQLRTRALAEMRSAETAFVQGLMQRGMQNRGDLDERLSEQHATAETYLEDFHAQWAALRETAIDHDLVTWPEAPLRFVQQPSWVRAAAPHLYFLPYRAPSAFDAPDEHLVYVPPLDIGAPESRKLETLRALNRSVVRLNYVIHHAGLGHHVQNAHARNAPSRIGRIAAVDGASRIAFFCGGTMAEGWACYATDLMAGAGVLSEFERLSEARARLRMCARAVVDISLHRGDFTIDQAAGFYEKGAGMPKGAARMEAIKNSMFPGAALMYFAGRDAIHDLRVELAQELGSEFRLRDFHDSLLALGSVPVHLMAGMMRDLARENRTLRQEFSRDSTPAPAD